MGRLSINSKSFKAYHQKRLDEKISIANKKIEEETKLLKEQIEQREIKEEYEKIKYSWRNEIIRESGGVELWSPVETSRPANSTTTTFEYPGGSRVTVSGLGGVETTPSTVTVNQLGDVFDVPAPEYSQYGLQGYARPLGNVNRRRDFEDVNPRLDASQEFAQNVNSDVFMNARVDNMGMINPTAATSALASAISKLGDPIAKDQGVKDAKDVFDYYMKWAENPNSNPVNLTNKISPEGQAYLQKLAGDPSVQGLTGLNKASALNSLYQQDLENDRIPLGLRNILGMPDMNKGDGFNVDKNGKVTFSKAYDFTNYSDIGGTDIKTGLPAMGYALSQGIGKHLGIPFIAGRESPTMNININVAAPSANANSLGQRGPDGGMTDAQIKAAQDKANAARRAGKMSDIRGSEANRPYTFDKETGEPQYTGWSEAEYREKVNEINGKYSDILAPYFKNMTGKFGTGFGSASDAERERAYAKAAELEPAQTAELNKLYDEYQRQTSEFQKAQEAWFAQQSAESEARAKAIDELDNEKDPHSDTLSNLYDALEKLKREGKLIKGYKVLGPGDEGYTDYSKIGGALGGNRKPIYTAAANELMNQIEAAQKASDAWQDAQQKKRDALTGQGGLPLGSTTSRGGQSTPPKNMSQSAALASQAAFARMNPQQRRKRGMKESTIWSRLKKYR